MTKVSFSDRLLAVLALAVALFSFGSTWLAFTGAGFTAWLAARGDPAGNAAALRITVLVPLGILCCITAWWFWTDRWPDRVPGRRSTTEPVFGRGSARPAPVARSRIKPYFAVVPFVAVLALAADWFVAWPSPGEQIAAEEPAPAPEPPAASPAEPPPADVAEAPPPEPPAPPAEAPPLPPADIIASPPPDLASPPPVAEAPAQPPAEAAPEQPPEVALAPAPPPETEAPLPPPEQPDTRPDGHREAVVWLALSPDGKSILSASTDGTIKLWDLDGRLIRDLGAHQDMARAALFLPDGARVVTSGDDGKIALRNVADGTVLHAFSATDHGSARQLAMTPDGRLLVSSHEASTVIVWDLEKKSLLHVLKGNGWAINGVAVSPDGTRIVAGSIDGELRLWDVTSGKLLRSWQGHERGTYGAAFLPDGRQFVTGSGDYTIKLWDLDTGKEVRRFEGHSGTVYAIALSADGTRLLSGSLDGTARLWDIATGRELAFFGGHQGTVNAVAFGPDGTMITGGGDRTIRRWRMEGGDEVAVILGGPQ